MHVHDVLCKYSVAEFFQWGQIHWIFFHFCFCRGKLIFGIFFLKSKLFLKTVASGSKYVVYMKFILTCIFVDLDQLNHILGILGSPGAEDLNCIINEKVSFIWILYVKTMPRNSCIKKTFFFSFLFSFFYFLRVNICSILHNPDN